MKDLSAVKEYKKRKKCPYLTCSVSFRRVQRVSTIFFRFHVLFETDPEALASFYWPRDKYGFRRGGSGAGLVHSGDA